MSNLESALQRFGRALDRLEAVTNRRIGVSGRDRVNTQISELRTDRAKLSEELDVMKAEARRLSQLNDRASEEIGAAVTLIRSVAGPHTENSDEDGPDNSEPAGTQTSATASGHS